MRIAFLRSARGVPRTRGSLATWSSCAEPARGSEGSAGTSSRWSPAVTSRTSRSDEHRHTRWPRRRARSVRLTRRFAPDAWLVYGATVKYPDLFGGRQRPGRYVLIGRSVSATPSACLLPGDLCSASPIAGRWLARTAWSPTVRRVREHLRSGRSSGGATAGLLLAIKTWSAVPTQETGTTPARAAAGRADRALRQPAHRPQEGRPSLEERDGARGGARGSRRLPRTSLLVIAGDGRGRARVEALGSRAWAQRTRPFRRARS